ncbi:uncharacterized protein LOC141619542 [Silene latifolia]|uniref:uncharacterized protein LOC141619542 n=1 Tax=Silene latifolia TaxID=37657 RepID=UPI003D788030
MNKDVNTRPNLYKIGYSSDDRCCICEGDSETLEHLFFRCSYIGSVIGLISDWCGLIHTDINSMTGNNTTTGSRVQKQVYVLVLNAYYYQVWAQRNNATMNAILLMTARVFKLIKGDVKHHVKHKYKPVVDFRDEAWLKLLDLM